MNPFQRGQLEVILGQIGTTNTTNNKILDLDDFEEDCRVTEFTILGHKFTVIDCNDLETDSLLKRVIKIKDENTSYFLNCFLSYNPVTGKKRSSSYCERGDKFQAIIPLIDALDSGEVLFNEDGEAYLNSSMWSLPSWNTHWNEVQVNAENHTRLDPRGKGSPREVYVRELEGGTKIYAPNFYENGRTRLAQEVRNGLGVKELIPLKK
jgi:hypothetical protein